jgi:F-box/leucine-rich repeat protein 14
MTSATSYIPVELIAQILDAARKNFECHDSCFSWVLEMRLVNHQWKNAVGCLMETSQNHARLKTSGSWSPITRRRSLGYFRLFMVSAPAMSKGFLESIQSITLAHTSVTDADLHYLARSAISPKSLDIRGCGRLTRTGLESVPNWPGLQSLSMNYRPEETSVAFFSKFPSLNALTLTVTKSPPLDGALCEILRHALPQLQSFSLANGSSLSDQSLVALSQRTELTSLELRECRGATDEGFKSLALNLIHLQSMTFTSNGCITATALQNLSKMTELRSLNLSYMNVVDSTLQAIGSLYHLERLNLSGCAKVSDEGIAYISRLRMLHHVTLVGCHELTDVSLAVLSELVLLESIEVPDCPRISDDGCKALAKLSKLEVLDLSENDTITDEGIKALAHLPLEGVFLENCMSLTEGCVDELLKVKTLQCIKLSGCPCIRSSSLQRFAPTVYVL